MPREGVVNMSRWSMNRCRWLDLVAPCVGSIVDIYIYIYIAVCARRYVYIYPFMHLCTHITSVHLYFYIPIHLYLYAAIHKYNHTYIHKYIHIKPLYLTTSTHRPLPYIDRFISVQNDHLYIYSNPLIRPPP